MDDHQADAERRAELIKHHGQPDVIAADTALGLARDEGLADGVTPDQVHAAIYRDKAASDAWLESNRVHHGHPALARFELPDGRVVGILDLRPALARAAEEAT